MVQILKPGGSYAHPPAAKTPSPASTWTPGTNPGPVAPPDAAGISTSTDGVLLTPGALQSEADIAKLEKKGSE